MATIKNAIDDYHRGRLDEAEAACRAILDREPANVAAWLTRGNALQRSGRLEDALASYDSAVAVSPDNADVLIARGTVLALLGRADEAVAEIDQVPLGASPVDLLRRADLLRRLGLYAAASRDFRQWINAATYPLPGWIGVAMCASECCDWPALEEPRRKLLAAVDAGQPAPPAVVLQLSSDPAQHLACARAYAPRAVEGAAFAPPPNTRPQRLRIAYLSPDFRVHPLAFLLAELLDRHDHGRFEILAVSFGPHDGSDIGARIAAGVDQFHDMQGRSDDDVVSLLRHLKVDIAVDLAGYTLNARSDVLARRVAPIQAAYLGYCGPSGSTVTDYLIADRIAVPPAEQRFFTEKLVYLPGSFMVADSTQPISDVAQSRGQYALPERGFVFCCFNRSYKITPPVFDIWLRLLRAVEGSVVWLSASPGPAQDNLRRYAAAQGVPPERLVFAAHVPRAEHFARHCLADLFLDTLPYNAHATACDALFAGLPVLTALGPSFAGRVAASMLHALGLAELVSRNLDEYEVLARTLAQDHARLSALRAKLAAHRQTWPLFQTERTCRNIEKAYDGMFDIYRRGEAPRSFDVA